MIIENDPVPPDQLSAPGLVKHIKELGNDLVGCELGVCRGYNLRYLLDRAPNIKFSYAIDPWMPYHDWCEYVDQARVDSWKAKAVEMLTPWSDKIGVLQMTSAEAAVHIADSSLDYIFVDGDHSYEATVNDCRLYWSKVKPGGIFSGHDWQLPDVCRAVTTFRQEFNITTEIIFTDYNVWFWHKE
jgi:hypothetical protein